MELATVIISLFAFGASVVGLLLSRRSNYTAKEANQKADESNQIAREANDLAQSANSYASESNVLSRQALDVSQNTFKNQYVPKITFQYGSGGDLTTNPPMQYFQIRAANEGYIPVLIDSIGFSIVGSQTTLPIFTLDVIRNMQPTLLPAEILPGRVLDFPLPLDSLRKNLQLNAKTADDEFTIRLVQQTGQYFETDRLKVKDYLGDELPMRVRFREQAPDTH